MESSDLSGKKRKPIDDEDDWNFDTAIDARGKIRIGKKSWRKLLIGLGTVLTGSVALGQILRRLIELWF